MQKLLLYFKTVLSSLNMLFTNNTPNQFSIRVTTTTGLEPCSQNEIYEKIGVNSSKKRGNIQFNILSSDINKLKHLCSVDNMYVIMNSYQDFFFGSGSEEALANIKRIVPHIHWSSGIEVWKHFFEFQHPISFKPQLSWQKMDLSAKDSNNLQTDENFLSDTHITMKNEKAVNDSISNEDKTKLPSFRVTCYRSANIEANKHSFKSPEAASSFGGTIQDYFGWNVSMKSHDIEVVLFIEDQCVEVCLALTRQSMHHRHITHFGSTTLRPTIAYNMLRMCNIQVGEIVCDPLCGSGAIPLEASINWRKCYHVAGDIYDACPAKGLLNLKSYNSKHEKNVIVDFLNWDVTNLPFKMNSVDVIVTDMPFGKRSGSRMNNWSLYPKALVCLARIAVLGTARLCVLTQDKKCFIKSLQSASKYWRQTTTYWVNIGGLSAGIFLLKRTNQIYNESEPDSDE